MLVSLLPRHGLPTVSTARCLRNPFQKETRRRGYSLQRQYLRCPDQSSAGVRHMCEAKCTDLLLCCKFGNNVQFLNHILEDALLRLD